MNFKAASAIGLAIFTLVSCTSNNDNHCIGQIDPMDMSEDNLAKVCSINIVPTTLNNKLLYIENEEILPDALITDITTKIGQSLSDIYRFIIVDPQQENAENVADYRLESNLDELVMTEDNIENQPYKIQKEATFSMTYNLISNKTNQNVFSNTVAISLLNRTFNESIVQSYISDPELAEKALGDIVKLFKVNFVNTLNPLRITEINETGDALLNQPALIGTICNIYNPQDYTNAVIEKISNNDDISIGSLQVVDTNAYTSYTKLIAGQAKPYDICKQIYIGSKLAWENKIH